jgi:hypothetical protein
LRSTRSARAAAALSASLAAFIALAGCGTHTQSDANEGAQRVLGWNVDTALMCLQDVAPDLQGELDPAALTEVLMPCGGITSFNHDDEAIRTVDPLDSVRGTIVVSGSTAGDQLTLQIVTSGSALAEAGHSRSRALVATCWQVGIDLTTHTVGEPMSSACNEAVIERKNPSEVVPFDEVTRDTTPTEEAAGN